MSLWGWLGRVGGLVRLYSVAFPGATAVGSNAAGFGDEGVDVWLRAIGTTWSAAPRVGSPTSVASRWSCRTHAKTSPELAVLGPIRARTGTSSGSATGLPAVHHWRVVAIHHIEQVPGTAAGQPIDDDRHGRRIPTNVVAEIQHKRRSAADQGERAGQQRRWRPRRRPGRSRRSSRFCRDRGERR